MDLSCRTEAVRDSRPNSQPPLETEARMANLTVWKFDPLGGAASASARLDTLAMDGAGRLVDGAVVEFGERSRH